MKNRLLALTLATFLPVTALAAPTFIRFDCMATPEQFKTFLEKSPWISPERGAPTPAPKQSPDEVGVYYLQLNWFNEPQNYDGRERHMIAPGSKPDFKYRKLARIEIYLPDRDDARGVAALKVEAAKLGADGIVDTMRLACIAPGVVATDKHNVYYRASGWGYTAEAVVRRKPKS